MHINTPLPEIVILLCAAVLIVTSFRLIRLSPVLGYLVAGAAIGPYGLKLITDVETTAGIAEFGVIFLLFLIGLELSFERLRGMRTHVFGFGGVQVLVTGGLFALFFLGIGGGEAAAIIIGFGLAMSSTAIVLQVVADQGEKSSQVGRLSLATLILQDLAVIPLLVLVPLVGNHDQSLLNAVAIAMVKGAAGFTLIFITGRLLLRPLFRLIASLEHTELFSATTILVILGTALATTMAGLSPALGAFVAGLLVAETEFKPQVEADMLPFKDLLLGLFFMSVGMSLDLNMLAGQFTNIIGISIALMGIKSLVIIALSRMFGFPASTAIHTGLLLSQGSEFAFVLFGLAATQNVLDPTLTQVLLVVVTASMALTPLVAQIGKKIAQTLEKRSVAYPDAINVETLDLSQHVIISGFGRVGHTVARLLEAENIPYVAIDMDAFQVSRERKRGLPVYYGDATRLHVLNALGVTRAKAVIITHNDTRAGLHSIASIRELNPSLPVIARAKNIEQVQKLEKAGANLAVAEMFETSLQLGSALLKTLSVNDLEISRIIDMFRAEDYMLTRSAEKEGAASN